jgi:hypothetical protein
MPESPTYLPLSEQTLQMYSLDSCCQDLESIAAFHLKAKAGIPSPDEWRQAVESVGGRSSDWLSLWRTFVHLVVFIVPHYITHQKSAQNT